MFIGDIFPFVTLSLPYIPQDTTQFIHYTNKLLLSKLESNTARITMKYFDLGANDGLLYRDTDT